MFFSIYDDIHVRVWNHGRRAQAVVASRVQSEISHAGTARGPLHNHWTGKTLLLILNNKRILK